ncbi:MAG: EFR1 family ferrodoxin, partial [Eubacterium sp.]|nr:EFR1 family ferrodoxin [Eubacterium sp.]
MLYSISFSPTGGTEKVAGILADYIQDALAEEKVSVDLVDKDFTGHSLLIRRKDIAVIALPSYGGRVPAVAASRIRKISGNGAKAVVIAVYGNRAYEDTLLELTDVACDSGFRVVAAVAAVAEHSIVREIAQGRPDEEDKEDLRKIADRILEKLDRRDDSRPDIPGNHPYKPFHGIALGTYAEDHCIHCGNCAFACPVGAIPIETPDAPSGGSCISCMRCVQVCPVEARKAPAETVEAIRRKIGPACRDRKGC